MGVLSPDQQTLARGLIEEGLIDFNQSGLPVVRLDSVIPSSRMLNLTSQAFSHLLARGLLVMEDGSRRYIDAVPHGATQYYAGMVAREAQAPLVNRCPVRRLTSGKEAVIMDNTIGDGSSQRAEVSTLREEFGLEAIGVVALVNCQTGGKSALEADGLRVEDYLSMSTLAMYALNLGSLSLDGYKAVRNHLDEREVSS